MTRLPNSHFRRLPLAPSALASDRRSLKLDGANGGRGGDGRLPIPIGEGGTLPVVVVGEVVGPAPPATDVEDG